MDLAYCGLNCGEYAVYLKSCAECGGFPCSTLEKNLGDNSDNLNRLRQLAAEYKKEE